MHSRRDAVAPIEMGGELAKHISGARFVSLESANHVALAGEPALEQMMEEIHLFLEQIEF